MNKKALLALLLAMTLLLSSCSLVAKNEKKDAARAVVAMNGQTVVTKADVQPWLDYEAEYIAAYYTYYYAMFGMNYNVTAADVMDEAKSSVENMMKDMAVVKAQAAAKGISLTEEEEAAALAELTGADDSKYGAIMKEAALYTALRNKLQDSLTGDLTVTDEELQTSLDEKVAADQTNYADADAYITAVMNGTKTYYRPAGYRMVRNLLIAYDEDDQTAIRDLYTKLSTQKSTMTSAAATLGDELDALVAQVTVEVTKGENGYEATATTTFDATEDADVQSKQDSAVSYAKAKALVDAYQADYDAALAKAKPAVQEKVDAAMARLDAGEDFVTVMNELTADASGMASNPDGYPVGANNSTWDVAFTEAAMSVETVGGYSQPCWGMYGAYIVQYASDVPAGTDTLADSEPLRAEMLATKKSEAFEPMVTEWTNAASWTVRWDILDD